MKKFLKCQELCRNVKKVGVPGEILERIPGEIPEGVPGRVSEYPPN